MEQLVCLSLVLCEQVVPPQPGEGYSIVKTLTGARFDTFPATLRCAVYVAIRGDKEGDVEFTLGFVDSTFRVLSEGYESIIRKAIIKISRLQRVMENAICIEAHLPAPGTYWCELVGCDDTVLVSYPFHAEQS